MAISKKEYTTIKEIILAHSTYTWCNGKCVPLANTNAVLNSLDNIFAEVLKIEREPVRQIFSEAPNMDVLDVAQSPKENKKKRLWG